MSGLTEHADHLRAVVQADQDTTLAMLVLINLVEDLAVEVDRLVDQHPRQPDDGQHFGSI